MPAAVAKINERQYVAALQENTDKVTNKERESIEKVRKN